MDRITDVYELEMSLRNNLHYYLLLFIGLLSNISNSLSITLVRDPLSSSFSLHFQSIQLEMEGKRSVLEDAIEMGAAINMQTSDEELKFSIDDKVAKLKQHWEQVWGKCTQNTDSIQQLIGEMLCIYRTMNVTKNIRCNKCLDELNQSALM